MISSPPLNSLVRVRLSRDLRINGYLPESRKATLADTLEYPKNHAMHRIPLSCARARVRHDKAGTWPALSGGVKVRVCSVPR